MSLLFLGAQRILRAKLPRVPGQLTNQVTRCVTRLWNQGVTRLWSQGVTRLWSQGVTRLWSQGVTRLWSQARREFISRIAFG